MPKDKKIAELLRQEKALEKELARLETKRRALHRKKENLFDRRWTLAVRSLVGKPVVALIGMCDEPELRQLEERIGTLRSVARDGMCQVDYDDLGIRELHAQGLRAADTDEWERLLSGK
ncbi:MAG: hypothetical protein ABFC77_11030 [Thermoguttaceae bacterium]